MFTKEQLNELARRVHQRDLSRVTNPFPTDYVADAARRKAKRDEEQAQRAQECWSYQPPKTVPLTWVDMTLWLLNKLGIRSRK